MLKNYKIGLIPLDNRPCNTLFPLQLASFVGLKLLLPSLNIIGNLKKIGDRQKLSKWLLDNQFNSLIISIDMLGYGGLVFSRKSDEEYSEIVRYLEVIKLLKAKNIKIYAFNTLMRISNCNDNTEEKDYWQNYGKLIYQYSVAVHKKDKEKLKVLEQKIPSYILDNYLKTRKRNFYINKLMLEWTKLGYIDFLILNIDDTGKYGLNVIEQRELKKIAKELNLNSNNLMIHCGADEITLLLLARLINKELNFKPKFYPIFSSIESPKHLTMYENCNLSQNLKAQVKAIGGKLVTKEELGDINLFIYSPYKNQGDQFLNKTIPQTSISPKKEFIEQINNSIDKKYTSIVDVAYANGGDYLFFNQLKTLPLHKLTSVAAWNTTANSIGTVLACANLYLIGKKFIKTKNIEKYKLEFLFERLCDDWLYQGYIRPKYEQKDIDLNYLKNRLFDEINKLFFTNFKDKTLNNTFKINDIKNICISFPWNRIFEIRLKCNLDLIKNNE